MKFYVLGKVEVGQYDGWFSPMKPDRTGDAPVCPVCERYVGALVWLPPYAATIHTYNSKLGDVVDGPGDSLLVSERFRLAWEERQLKGIDTFTPLERIRVRPARLGKPAPVYYHIAPRMFGAKVDFTRSHFKYGGLMCEACRTMRGFKSVKGFVIEDGTWTGEDIFRPWGFTGTVVVTDRVRQLRDDYDLKNVELTPTEEEVFPPEHKAEETS